MPPIISYGDDITLSLANGFQEKWGKKVFSFLGHIRIQEKATGKSHYLRRVSIIKNDDPVNESIQCKTRM
ncbi:MAG: hypothetical protein IPO68_15710 [Chitinophagaceae bacterium]|nr:hypothetical protein [Chitinophagaceae bacterium]